MRYLVFNINEVEELPTDDLTELTDEQFEELALQHGYIFESSEEFESAFNSELISTATDQIRVISESYTSESYYNLRNSLFKDLVSCGVTSDEDENFQAFDNVLGNNLNVSWD